MAKPPIRLDDRIELVIERLSLGGSGVGRYQGFVVFVPYSAPQDRLLVTIKELKKSFAVGQILEILNPSPLRVPAPCPVFGRCGGCTWQHIPYPEQLRQKQGIVEQSVHRSSLLRETPIQPILPSPEAWRYRNRIQIRVGSSRLGFFVRGSHEIADIQDCPISDSRLSHQFQDLRSEFGASDEITKIELHVRGDGTIQRSVNLAHGEEFGFEQVNPSQNQNLLAHVTTLMQPLGPKRILDLYCGKGNFAFPLAEAFPLASIEGVELNPKAVKRAQATLAQNPHLHARLHFINQDVATFLKTIVPDPTTVVLIDPPRVGCDPVVIEMLKRSKLKIVYVSCNPATFVRDAERLVQDQGLRLVHLQPLDMFPQTDHIELIGMFV